MDEARETGTRSSTPGTRQSAIWTERAVLALILGMLAGTFNLVLAIQRRSATIAASPAPAPVVLSEGPKAPAQSVASVASSKPSPPQPAEVLPPPEDPTVKALARLTKATAAEVDAAQDADRRAQALETAHDAAVAESQRWKRREMLVRQQIAGLAARANELESAASALDLERDVLAKERDALKAALSKARQRSGFAVLPYKGPNGTWRRPIVLECSSASVKLQPKGAVFPAMDLSPIISPRLNPLVKAVARELLHIQGAETPDGAAAVPYLVFLVRPSGIRVYYEARACLEPLGIAFGYELIEQDLAVDIPDFDNLASWDGTVPLELPLESAPRSKLKVAINSSADPGNASATRSRGGQQTSSGWPGRSGPDGEQSADDHANSDESAPEDFVWPSRGRSNSTNDRRAAPPSVGAGIGGKGDGADTGAFASSTDPRSPLAAGSPSNEGSGSAFGGSKVPSSGPYAGSSTVGSFGSGRYPVGGLGSSIGRGGSGSGLASDPGTGIGGSVGSGTGPSGASSGSGGFNALPRGGGSGDGPDQSPGGGTGSDFGTGAGGGSGSLRGAGSGSRFGRPAGTGTGSDAASGVEGGSSSFAVESSASGRSGGGDTTPGLAAGNQKLAGSTAALPPAGSLAGPGTSAALPPGSGLPARGSTAALPSGGGQSRAVGSQGVSGAGSSPNSTAAANGLPDLEPAGDGAMVSSQPPAPGSSPGGPAGLGVGAGQTSVPAPAAPGLAAPAGSGPESSSSETGGPLRAPIATPEGQTTPPTGGSAAGASDATGGGKAPADADANATNEGSPANSPGSNSGGAVPATQPTSTQSAGSTAASNSSASSSASSSPSSSTNTSGSGQPALGLNSTSDLTSSSSAPSSPPSGLSLPFSFGSSATSPTSSSSIGGTPADSPATSSSSSNASASAGQAGNPKSDASSSDDFIFAPPPKRAPPPKSIEVPFEIVVVCRRDDVLLHPGGYRLTTQIMTEKKPGADGMLAREIVAIVRKRAIVDPLIRPKPKIRFLVENGGAETFWVARRQLMFSLPEWPTSLQVAGPQSAHVFNKETW